MGTMFSDQFDAGNSPKCNINLKGDLTNTGITGCLNFATLPQKKFPRCVFPWNIIKKTDNERRCKPLEK